MKKVPTESKLLYIAAGLAALATLTSGNPTFLLGTAVFAAVGYSFSH